MLKLCRINNTSTNRTLGLHLSRAPWDPYPWVSGIQDNSNAYLSGIRIGDTILELNGIDILGKKISQLAEIIHKYWDNGGDDVEFLIWRNNKNEENTINQHSLQKFATCLQNIAQLLECPICLEIVKPPGWQCCNGHVLCNSCRGRTVKCPICRVTLGPKGRCLLSDKLFTLLTETFPCDVKNRNLNSNNNNNNNRNKYSANHKMTNNLVVSKTITCPEGFQNDNNNNYYNSSNINRNTSKKQQMINLKNDLKSSLPQNNNMNESYNNKIQSSTLLRFYNNKNYHCPTGKSSCGKEYDENFKMYNHWDILTHLRRIHKISVTQYCGTYGERMQVELMNKSISCISIVSEWASTSTLTPTSIPLSSSSLSSSSTSSSSSSLSSSLSSLSSTKNFVENSSIQTTTHKTAIPKTTTPSPTSINTRKILATKMKNTTTTTKTSNLSDDKIQNEISTIPVNSSDNTNSSDCCRCNNVDSRGFTKAFIDQNKKMNISHNVELFFIARIPIEDMKVDNKDENCMNSTNMKNLNVDIHDDDNDNNDDDENDVDDDADDDDDDDNDDDNSKSSCRNENIFKSNSNKRYAIFIWYCGNEINVKKFQAVIECNRTGTKWTSFIHPMTKSWNLVKSQNEFHQFNFNVTNPLNVMIKRI